MVKKLLILLSLYLLLFQIVNACGCHPTCAGIVDPKKCAKKRVKSAEAVFYGKVVELKDLDAPRRYEVKFEVEKAWKGIKSNVVTVSSIRDNGANCGFNFEIGEKYLLFATGSGEKFSAGGCSIGNYYLSYLGKGYKPKERK